MTQSRTGELIDRLTSRKFLLCLVTIMLSTVGYMTNHITFEQMQTTVLLAVGTFSAAEGLTDAATMLNTSPPTKGPTQTVNVSPDSGDVDLGIKPSMPRAPRPTRTTKGKS